MRPEPTIHPRPPKAGHREGCARSPAPALLLSWQSRGPLLVSALPELSWAPSAGLKAPWPTTQPVCCQHVPSPGGIHGVKREHQDRLRRHAGPLEPFKAQTSAAQTLSPHSPVQAHPKTTAADSAGKLSSLAWGQHDSSCPAALPPAGLASPAALPGLPAPESMPSHYAWLYTKSRLLNGLGSRAAENDPEMMTARARPQIFKDFLVFNSYSKSRVTDGGRWRQRALPPAG